MAGVENQVPFCPPLETLPGRAAGNCGGGGYLGVCAVSYLACDGFSWGLKILDAKTVSGCWRRGVGEFEVQWAEAGRGIWKAGPSTLKVQYANGSIWTRSDNPELDDLEVLGYFRSELAKNETPVGAMIDSPTVVRAAFGSDRLLCSSPHLDLTPGREAYLTDVLRWLIPNAGESPADRKKKEAVSNESH